MNASELRQQTIVDLNKQLLELSRELFNLRIQQGVGSLTRKHSLPLVRRNIARVKTIISEKQLQGEQ